MQRIRVGAIELATIVEGSGPPWLFVHGFPLDHSMWRAQREALSSAHRVIVPDLRGFGRSDVTPGTVTMEQFADDLAALLDALEVKEPVTLCGLSMGGYVAWQFFRRHRDRLAALVLCDTRAVPDDEQGAKGRHDLAARVLAEGSAVVARAMAPKLFAPSTSEQQPDLVAQVREVIEQSDPEGVAAALRGMAARSDARDLLAKIDLPTLVLVGKHDAISPADEMRELAGQIPDAQFVEIADAGHMAPVENPRAVNEALKAFAQR